MRRLLLIAVIAASCATPSASGEFVMSEFALSGPGVVAAGEVSFALRNLGEFSHTVLIADEDGSVVAATDVVPPGEEVELDVALEPGEYQVSCRIVIETPDGEIVDHYERGMFTSLRVDG